MGKFQDLTGQQFERLTVVKRVKNHITPSGQIQPMWLCQCNCNGENSEIIVRGCHLRSGHTNSCGCLQKEKASISGKLRKKYNTYDLSNNYGIGYTSKNEPFYFDLDDFNKIKFYWWYKDDNGYIITRINNKNYFLMHRLVMNCPDDMEVDHIYHQTHDNRKSELRIVNKSQNQMNGIIPKNNTSGIKGVCWHKTTEKWIAKITVGGKNIYLGVFDNFDDAVQARKEAEEKYFGEYNYIE